MKIMKIKYANITTDNFWQIFIYIWATGYDEISNNIEIKW